MERRTDGVKPGTMEEALAVIAELGGVIDQLGRENAALQHRVHLLCQRIFGRQSEKDRIDPAVQPLLPYFETAAAPVAPDATDEAGARPRRWWCGARRPTTAAARRRPICRARRFGWSRPPRRRSVRVAPARR